MTDDDKPKKPTLVSIDGDAGKSGQADHGNAPNAKKQQMEGANDEALRHKLARMEQEHRDLDHAIDTLEERMPYDRLTIQRLKKKKLALKDEITKLHDELLPDIIA
ncbi:YdcH family protein [Parvularcula sp. LCG005]|uniref:YdcH family protein n=1 Tax=Parvularcula sp. LCG005 TaxID=3078805 RepID=UPI002942DD04|nr:DUF465 domain-containing protein [Parvularcula sp. LCG005]WOI54547.1 DUF465 domain-containing protein [Parvularcula sp. LCG005]